MKVSKRYLILLFSAILLMALAFPTPVLAQGITFGDSIPAGTVLDYDAVLIGQNVVIDGTVNGNVIVLGNQVIVNGEVNGSLILIGQNIIINGSVSGGTYAVGLTLELAAKASIKRDLYVLSVGLASGKDTTVERDLYALGLDAGLNGTVGRDLHTSIGPIQLYNGLMRLLGFEELTIKLHFELPKPQSQPTATPTSLRFPTSRHARMSIVRLAKGNPFDWEAWGIAVTREWVVLSLFGLLTFWLLRKPLDNTSMPLYTHPWRTFTLGLLVLVISFNLFVLAILLGALIFSIGLALNYLGLWQLSIALWMTTYSALLIAMTSLWFFIVYGTKVIFIYSLFTWLSNKLGPSTWWKILGILIGMLVYVLLRSVPYIGWVFGVLVTAAGMGMTWLSYRSESAMQVSEPIQKGVEKKGRTKA